MMAEPGGGFGIDSIPLFLLLVVAFRLPGGGHITAERTAQLWTHQSCGEKIVFLYESVSSFLVRGRNMSYHLRMVRMEVRQRRNRVYIKKKCCQNDVL